MPLAGDWQRAELARSVTLPILRWPNPAAAEADGERKAAADGRFPTRAAVYPGVGRMTGSPRRGTFNGL